MSQLFKDDAVLYLRCLAEKRGLRFPVSLSNVFDEVMREPITPSSIKRGAPRSGRRKWNYIPFRRVGIRTVFDTRDLDAWFDSIEENLCVATPRTFSIQRTLDKLH